jgi:hypothetical protein
MHLSGSVDGDEAVVLEGVDVVPGDEAVVVGGVVVGGVLPGGVDLNPNLKPTSRPRKKRLRSSRWRTGMCKCRRHCRG